MTIATVAPFSTVFDRVILSTILKAEDGGVSLTGQTITVGGWVKTGRKMKGEDGKHLAFLEINDGSCFGNLQVLVSANVHAVNPLLLTGCSVVVKGELKKSPEGKSQLVEVYAAQVLYHGPSPGATYPLAKGKVNDPKKALENLRGFSHLRPRTNVIGAVARIRHNLAMATHRFYDDFGFYYVHTPLITHSDCEGAGEMFQVSTLLQENTPLTGTEVDELTKEMEELGVKVSAQGGAVKEAKQAKKSKDEITAEVTKLLDLKKEKTEIEGKLRSAGGMPRDEKGNVDYTTDFFGKPSFMTVSGQLQVENYCCSLSNVYTFGPTFRAEKSNTHKHLAEFWMIEPEIAFADIKDAMNLAEAYIKYCCQYLLDRNMDELEFLSKFHGKNTVERLNNVVNNDFTRITYTEAIDVLLECVAKGEVEFEFEVKWGIDLKTEHESYLAETVYGKPTIVYDYPVEIKSFYMRLNDDKKTVGAMDILVPEVGELVGGSQREERLDVLEQRMKESGLNPEDYGFYVDLRKYGTVPHSGFGVGFERLIMFCTRLKDIRDIIPFPRWYKHLTE